MLQHLVHFFLITLICCLWGIPILLVTGTTGTPHPWYRSVSGLLSFLFLSGCLTLCLLTSWLYLFFPLRFSLLLGLTVILVLLLSLFGRSGTRQLFQQAKKDRPPFSWSTTIFLLIGVLVFLALSCLKSINGDTQYYHTQIIQWGMQYKAIPGIANLYSRLGLGSGWLGLISFFYLPFPGSENFAYLNASLVCWTLIGLLSTWRHHLAHFTDSPAGKIFSLFYFLILIYGFADWHLFRDAANSTNYDFIVTATSLLSICFLLESVWQPDYNRSFSFIFIFLALSAASLKLSGIFILLLVACHLFQHFSLTRLASCLLLSFLFFTPILIKNYILTGYPLYPLPIRLGSPDWQMPKELVGLLHNYILLSNRFLSQDFYNGDAFREQHAFWLPFWWNGLGWIHRILLLLTLSSVFLLFTKTTGKIYIGLLLLMAAGWFLTAPSPRFAFGLLMTLAFLPISIWLGPKITASWYIPALWGLTLVLCCYLPQKFALFTKEPAVWLRPVPIETPTYRTITVNNIPLHLPDLLYQNTDHRAYNTPIPCISQENPWLSPRGSSLTDGFRMNTPDSNFIKNYSY